MKKAITITCINLSALLILDSMNAAQAAVMFIIAGNIPGTDIFVSATGMLTFFLFLLGIVTGRITARAIPALRRMPLTTFRLIKRRA